jgi:uncharacterized glyoxalase superfamily protein PhnB
MGYMEQIEFILYVADQNRSRDFYQKVLQTAPTLDVPGMTEFALSAGCTLGLMPEKGIKKILMDKTPDPVSGNGIPRCELYLVVKNVKDVNDHIDRAIRAGGKLVSDIQPRDWGHTAGYIMDPDGHIIAFSSPTEKN